MTLEKKLAKLLSDTHHLKEQLYLPRIAVSEASESLIYHTTCTPDPFLPSHAAARKEKEDMWKPNQRGGCMGCSIM
ncbi:hypothetical protein DFS34DRAFT_202584 [Phlyctochytrium arcticum]|nr:hypothetical protein DFS34DRAFT_202584 [Phlyctochytrium arcticum]